MAGPGFALSCVPADSVRTYLWAKERPEAYLVVKGSILNGDTVPVPEARLDRSETPSTEGVVQFKGKSLGDSGFATPFVGDITLRLSCIASWCPRGPGPQEVIAFLEQTEDGYLLDMDACQSWVVPTQDPSQTRRLSRCHRTGNCKTLF